jgi:integrase
LQFEALITTARQSANRNDFALIAMLGLLGLRIFEASGANISDLGEEHGHRVLRVRGKGGKVVLIPLPPAVARALDRAVDARDARRLPGLRNIATVTSGSADVRMSRRQAEALRLRLLTSMRDW